VPFGYLVARARGVDILKVGSGNIGATNVSRVLGRRFGLAVFVLDCMKGALPAALAQGVAGPAAGVTAGLAAFLGHLFPIWLGFRGGKGVATGAGVVAVLVPAPAAMAVIAWAAVASASRYVSLASVAAALVIAAVQLALPDAFGPERAVLTAFCLAAALLVVVKHAKNLARLARGTENRLADTPLWHSLCKLLHVLALGLWFGTVIFFNMAGVLMFNSFTENVEKLKPGEATARTANVAITAGLKTDQERKDLAGALFGTAVGPLFPPFFVIQVTCGLVALVTAFGFGGRLNRWRLAVIVLGLVTLAIGWPLANYVGDVRMQRYSTDPAIAAAARAAFGPWHTRSLFLNFGTAGLATAAMALAAFLPERKPTAP
jgi:acyl-phosphate glycerol 3-phosphate acyltransferase